MYADHRRTTARKWANVSDGPAGYYEWQARSQVRSRTPAVYFPRAPSLATTGICQPPLAPFICHATLLSSATPHLFATFLSFLRRLLGAIRMQRSVAKAQVNLGVRGVEHMRCTATAALTWQSTLDMAWFTTGVPAPFVLKMNC